MNKVFKVFIPPDKLFSEPIWHTLQLIGRNKNVHFEKTATVDMAQFVVGENMGVAISFYETLHKGIFSHEYHFKNDCFIRNTDLSRENRDGVIDYLATIFYMVNCLQEYNPVASALDKYGRFRFEESFQYRFQNITENHVQRCIDAFCNEHDALKYLAHQHQPTKVLLTHDIDSLYGAWKYESIWALKQGRLGLMFKIIAEFFLQNHSWFTIDKMLKIHTDNDVKSTFFWITQQGRDNVGIKNADYAIQSSVIQKTLNTVLNQGFEVGLHKSSLKTSFLEEKNQLPQGHIAANRFHFLKYNIPMGWQALEIGAVALDTSLGFVEAYGFRNGYGLPFAPFDWSQQRTLKTLVTPLNIMDGTLGDYMKIPVNQIQNHIIDFFEKHKYDALITLLWHNTEFSEYSFKAYIEIYKNILLYLKENETEITTIRDVLTAFS
jgi:peptidoglycan/xylan/chitin deacetylase (PgdA/CDA1 family)